MNTCWKKSWSSMALAGFLLAAALAPALAETKPLAKGPKPAAGFGFMAKLDRTVGLNPEQRDSVRGLLAEQRQASQTLREQTDQKIRAILTPEQQKKFDALLAEQKNRRSASKNAGA